MVDMARPVASGASFPVRDNFRWQGTQQRTGNCWKWADGASTPGDR